MTSCYTETFLLLDCLVDDIVTEQQIMTLLALQWSVWWQVFFVCFKWFLKVSIKSGARHVKIPMLSVVFCTSVGTVMTYYFQVVHEHS